MLETQICETCGHKGIIRFDPAYDVDPEHDPNSIGLDAALAEAAQVAVEVRAGLNWTLDMLVVALENEINQTIYGPVLRGDFLGSVHGEEGTSFTLDQASHDLEQYITNAVGLAIELSLPFHRFVELCAAAWGGT